MTYVETRTEAQEVLRDASREVCYVATALINAVSIFTRWPAYNTKTALRADFQRLVGAYLLANRVSGGRLSAEAEAQYERAGQAIESLK